MNYLQMRDDTDVKDTELGTFLSTLDPKTRDDLRRVLIHDQADRDAIASHLLHYRDKRGDDWADIIDMLTMHPEARRKVARLLGEMKPPTRDNAGAAVGPPTLRGTTMLETERASNADVNYSTSLVPERTTASWSSSRRRGRSRARSPTRRSLGPATLVDARATRCGSGSQSSPGWRTELGR
jgi:hypothetical protein